MSVGQPRMTHSAFHPPSPEAPPLGAEQGRADKATAKQHMTSERLRPTGVQAGATGVPVGLHIPQSRRTN